ncbi:hypothetical protein ABPG75_001754 [Micractinium tetrahymenae]
MRTLNRQTGSSPARWGGAAFDPFAPPPDSELPGCTPQCAQLAAAPPAPHRKPAPAEVKRSLNGAVAAAGGTAMLARHSLDAPQPAPQQQLAGISRKRIEADLVSPPLPRKSSRTLLDGEHAADMLARLHLAGGTGSGGHDCGAPAGAMQWAPAPG